MGVGISDPPLSPASGGGAAEVNGTIAGGTIAAIVVVLITVGVAIIVWLVRRHRKVLSLQMGTE